MEQVKSKTKINKVTIIGTLTEVDTKIRTSSNGKEFISGKIVVKANKDGVESSYDIKVLAFKLTAKGEENKLFTAYNTLEGKLNKRIKVTAELSEDGMVQPSGDTINKFNTIRLKFVNDAKDAEEDGATFSYSGFVVKPIYERKNKDDEVIGYRIEIGQANYNDTNMQVIKFDIDKDDMNIVQAIESCYDTGLTVEIGGEITCVSRIETKTKEVAFGQPQENKYVVTDKRYRILSGCEPLTEDNEMAYTEAEIKKFVAAYKEADVKKLQDSKEASTSAVANPTAAAMNNITKRTSSLI